MNKKELSLRPDLVDVKSYVPHQFIAEVRLHANESPFDLPDEIRKTVLQKLRGLHFNRYPNATADSLRAVISADFELRPENVLVGNGSNEVIQSLLLTYGGPERIAVTFEPTYTMHGKICQITGTRLKSLALSGNFQLDAGLVWKELEKIRPDIIFVCNPNNPTGNLMDLKAIEELLGSGALIVVDEAYGEFANKTVVPWLSKYHNLVVVKTFSKAFRLAGLRLGYLLAREEIIAEVNKVKLPYNVNAFSQLVAEQVFQNRQIMLKWIEAVKQERERVYRELLRLAGVKPYPSETNFILFRTTKNGNEIWQALLDRSILIRNFSDYPSLDNCLRVTIGLPDENKAFLKALKSIIDGR